MDKTPLTVGECIVHLKFFAAITDLRDELPTIDGLFCLSNSLPTSSINSILMMTSIELLSWRGNRDGKYMHLQQCIGLKLGFTSSQKRQNERNENIQLPNIIISKALNSNILDLTGCYQNLTATIERIHDDFEYSSKKERHAFAPRDKPLSPQTRPENIAFRRLLSQYWGNSSILSLDLVGAVIEAICRLYQRGAVQRVHLLVLRGFSLGELQNYYEYVFDIEGEKAGGGGEF
ncbi:hypothetical protein AJ78_03460 [Emergomyces pasteurianus Ep9510]|uniref:Uncharacterized protein n=1 Tax=Emergomyces pasteurianus Ep9510 TaxID=1447872 RepID=A0A1J9PIT0_9EURO|nr:hypothetical protein AJ78_03460 [Emergomyces pasteurianus Ep9510]